MRVCISGEPWAPRLALGVVLGVVSIGAAGAGGCHHDRARDGRAGDAGRAIPLATSRRALEPPPPRAEILSGVDVRFDRDTAFARVAQVIATARAADVEPLPIVDGARGEGVLSLNPEGFGERGCPAPQLQVGPLGITVSIEPSAGLVLQSPSMAGGAPQGPPWGRIVVPREGTCPSVPRKGTDLDLPALTSLLREIAAQLPPCEVPSIGVEARTGRIALEATGTTPTEIVLIGADPRTPWQEIVAATDAAAEAGFPRARLRAREPAAGCQGAIPPVALAGRFPVPSLPSSIAALVAPAGGRVGFAALDLASGRRLGLNENELFPTQSVFKLPVAIEALHQVDAGKLDLARVIALEATDLRGGAATTIKVPAKRTVGELLEAMIINSDNVACDKLLALLGGPGLVDARMRKLGVDGITVRFSELEMQTGKVDNQATPTAMVALLAKIARRQTGLSPASARRLDDLLLRVATGQKRLKGELPPGTPVAHKTGTSQTANGKTNATNDVGLITLPNGHRIAIAVFVNASPADEPTRERTIAQLARFAFDTFRQPALRLPPR